jgi:hypothetical protein
VFKSNLNPVFRSKFSEDIFNQKYRHEGAETWDELCEHAGSRRLFGTTSPIGDMTQLAQLHRRT